MAGFDVPVVLFIFKRDKAVEIIKRIGQVKPKKLYILADAGRNEQEQELALSCRKKVEEAIDWDCEIVKNYAQENRGVYENIGEGAKWVLRQEKHAIFLEDDNLPEISFFQFCKEMLERYENDTRILWICGTNYLGDYKPKDDVSYVFTRHMLPCGWASWASKFERFYNGNLSLCENDTVMERISDVYCNKKVYRQYRDSWMGEYNRIKSGKRPVSWDYQMDLTIKANNLFGICPCKNQIKNIGVDEFSIHGGNDFAAVMTKRFCGMDSFSIDFPLRHPETLMLDEQFEREIGKIILYPLRNRVKMALLKSIRKLLSVPPEKSTKDFIKNGFK